MSRQTDSPEPLTLDQAIQQALLHDGNLAACYSEVGASIERLSGIAATDAARVNVYADYSLRSDDSTIRFPAVSTGIPFLNQSSGIVATSLRLPLYRGRTHHDELAGAIDVQLAELMTNYEQRSLRLRVVNSYLALIRAKAKSRLCRQDVACHESVLAEAMQQSGLGLHSEVEVSRNRADLAAAQSRCELARATEANSRTQLATLLGRAVTDRIVLTTPQPTMSAPRLQFHTSQALRHREELVELRAQLARLQANTDAVHSESLPQVQMHGDMVIHNNDFVDPNFVAQLGVSLDWEPIDGGRRRAQIAALRHQSRAIAQRLAAAEQQVEAEVRMAHNRWNAAQMNRHAAQAKFGYHFEVFQTAVRAQQQGQKTETEIAHFRLNLEAAAVDELESLLDLVSLEQELLFLTGL